MWRHEHHGPILPRQYHSGCKIFAQVQWRGRSTQSIRQRILTGGQCANTFYIACNETPNRVSLRNVLIHAQISNGPPDLRTSHHVIFCFGGMRNNKECSSNLTSPPELTKSMLSWTPFWLPCRGQYWRSFLVYRDMSLQYWRRNRNAIFGQILLSRFSATSAFFI